MPEAGFSATSLSTFLHKCLFEDVMPFWLRHSIDPAGGINTCLADDGQLICRDKWLWSQWRAVWVFSKLYNITRESRWLDIARHIYNFARVHGWNELHQGWNLRLSHDGKVLDGYESIYCDGFAIYGLAEYIEATGAPEAAELATRTADAVIEKLHWPHERIPHFPYPIESGTRVHGLPMIFSLSLWELGQVLGKEEYSAFSLRLSDDIFANFYRPSRDLILERISQDSSEYPAPHGTAVVPGHVIEDMWFQIHIAREQGNATRVSQACHLIRRHLELGWDETYGGILLGIDVDGRNDVAWGYHDTKLWWPHTEAMYALLCAYTQCRESWCLDWYAKVHEYAFSHFPHPNGEWVQRLDRQGKPITTVVALPVKDPFHLPRALIYCLEALQSIQQKVSTS